MEKIKHKKNLIILFIICLILLGVNMVIASFKNYFSLNQASQTALNSAIISNINSSNKDYSNNYFSFSYDPRLYLLDRLIESDGKIYISDKPIEYNAFLNEYFEPIEIAMNHNYVKSLVAVSVRDKKIIYKTINSNRISIITGTLLPEDISNPYGVYIVDYVDKNLTIIGRNIHREFDYISAVNQIVNTLKFN